MFLICKHWKKFSFMVSFFFFFHSHKMFNVTISFFKAILIYLIKCITSQDDVI